MAKYSYIELGIRNKLDNEDNKSLISAVDYNFLTQICDNRNHCAYNVFLEFVYKNNWINSKEYQKQCTKLEKDHDRVEAASDILDKIRIDYCKSIRKYVVLNGKSKQSRVI